MGRAEQDRQHRPPSRCTPVPSSRFPPPPQFHGTGHRNRSPRPPISPMASITTPRPASLRSMTISHQIIQSRQHQLPRARSSDEAAAQLLRAPQRPRLRLRRTILRSDPPLLRRTAPPRGPRAITASSSSSPTTTGRSESLPLRRTSTPQPRPFADNGRGAQPIFTAITATTALTMHTRARLSDDDGPMREIEPPPIRNKSRNPLRNYVQYNTRVKAHPDHVAHHLRNARLESLAPARQHLCRPRDRAPRRAVELPASQPPLGSRIAQSSWSAHAARYTAPRSLTNALAVAGPASSLNARKRRSTSSRPSSSRRRSSQCAPWRSKSLRYPLESCPLPSHSSSRSPRRRAEAWAWTAHRVHRSCTARRRRATPPAPLLGLGRASGRKSVPAPACGSPPGVLLPPTRYWAMNERRPDGSRAQPEPGQLLVPDDVAPLPGLGVGTVRVVRRALCSATRR